MKPGLICPGGSTSPSLPFTAGAPNDPSEAQTRTSRWSPTDTARASGPWRPGMPGNLNLNLNDRATGPGGRSNLNTQKATVTAGSESSESRA